jgi:hypothetical protein
MLLIPSVLLIRAQVQCAKPNLHKQSHIFSMSQLPLNIEHEPLFTRLISLRHLPIQLTANLPVLFAIQFTSLRTRLSYPSHSLASHVPQFRYGKFKTALAGAQPAALSVKP